MTIPSFELPGSPATSPMCVKDFVSMMLSDVGRRIRATPTLHIEISIHRIKHAVIYALTQFDGLDNFVFLAINQVNCTIAPVRDYQAIRLGEKNHRKRLPEALNTPHSFPSPEVEHLHRLVFLGGEK